MIVAIDGPAGSGKSTVANAIARLRGFTYLDTGAMYRSVALAAARAGVDPEDEGAVGELAQGARITFGKADDGSQTVYLDGCDVTADIRTPEVDATVSLVARQPRVRQIMGELQRSLAAEGDVVAEGRDIGTVVFPQAQVKVFLTASPETRAHRRADQNRARGGASAAVDEQKILASIKERDRIDSSRAVAPLVAAPDAVHVDSSALGADEVVSCVCGLIDAATAQQP